MNNYHDGHPCPTATYPCAKRSSEGRTHATTWGQVRRALTTHSRERAPDKGDVPCWAPHTFRVGTGRKANNIDMVWSLVLDFDQLGDSVSKTMNQFQGFERVSYATYSSVAGAEKSRLVLPLKEPVAGTIWPSVIRIVMDSLSMVADQKCTDPSRLFLLPCMGPDTQSAFEPGDLLSLAPAIREAETRAELQKRAMERRAIESRRAAQFAQHSDKAWAYLLATSPDARADAAHRLGLAIVERSGARIAIHGTCPACGQRSVWFPIDNQRSSGAFCNHKNSCGWSGSLASLLGRP